MGVGKSTIGNLLHKSLKGSAIVNTALLKGFLSDFKGRPEEYQILVSVMLKMSEEFLNKGVDVIIPQGFWKREYVEPYIELARKKKVKLFFYQLEASLNILQQRIKKRDGLNPTKLAKANQNLKKWNDNRYVYGKVFNTSKLTAKKILGIILLDLKLTGNL